MILIPLLSLVALYGARVLYAPAYPGDPTSYLQLVSQHQALASISWSLWILIDFLGLAPTVAMYLLLHRYNRTFALLGSLFLLAYAIYDFGVTELNSLTLVSLGHEYALASAESLRASLAAAAAYGYYALPFQTVLSFAIGSVGYTLWTMGSDRRHRHQHHWDPGFGLSCGSSLLFSGTLPVPGSPPDCLVVDRTGRAAAALCAPDSRQRKRHGANGMRV